MWATNDTQRQDAPRYSTQASMTSPEPIDNNPSRPLIQPKKKKARIKQYTPAEPTIDLQDSVASTKTTIQQSPATQLIAKAKQLTPKKIQIKKPPKPVVTPAPTKVVDTKAVDIKQLRLANVVPTIQPIRTDSTGTLRLKGNAAPNNHLLLSINGHKASNILVPSTGEWQYETHLKPGKYTVQVMDSRNLKQSAPSTIVIPEIIIPKPQIQTKPTPSIPPKVQLKWSNPDPKPKQIVPAANISTMPKVSTRIHESDLYRVKPGDTLHALSKQYAVTVREITRLNNIPDKHQIEVGQLLKMPKH
jgi:LysM repeat protein